MKKLVFTLAIVLISISAFSQEKSDSLWSFNGVTSINFSQMSLTNWAAGGENSAAVNGIINLNANYKSSDEKVSWTNELNLGYGRIKQGNKDAAISRKSNDKIDFASKYGYKATNSWFYSGLLSFKSQFAEGVSNPGTADEKIISNFLSPAYVNLSVGMDYKPSDAFTMLIAPVTGKMTMVMDDALSAAGAFGVEPGKNVRSEFGGYIKIAYSKEILKNIKLNTKIDLFSNYIEDPQYVDVNFDLLLSFKVNEFISASFISQVIYDHDIQFDVLDDAGVPTGETESRIQFKELFGIGLTYSF